MDRRWIDAVIELVSRRRRILAAVLAAGSVGSVLYVLAPPAAPSSPVLAAARDLAGGATLSTTDVTVVSVPPALVPAGALRPGRDTDGLLVAGAIRRGELLTDARFVGSPLLDQLNRLDRSGSGAEPGGAGELVATPIRLADTGMAGLLSAGVLVDVLAAESPGFDPTASDETAVLGASSGVARVVASGVRVLAVPQTAEDDPLGGSVGSDGPLVVLATDRRTAAALAAAAVTARLSIVIRAHS